MADSSETVDEHRPLLSAERSQDGDEEMAPATWSRRNQWIAYALASGACAAFNGVFAKLYVCLLCFLPFHQLSQQLFCCRMRTQ